MGSKALLQARKCIFVSLYNTFNNTILQKRYMLEYINTVHTLFRSFHFGDGTKTVYLSPKRGLE